MTSNKERNAAASAGETVTRKDLRTAFWRSFLLSSNWNYERQQNTGYAFAMTSIITKLYQSASGRAAALKRHLEFFNTAQIMSTFIIGTTIAREEQNAQDPNFDASAISNIKIALMSPLAGIGDSLFRSTLRVLGTGIATTFCMQGSILGPILFLLIYNIPHLIIRWFGTFLGYRMGINVLKNMEANGIMEKITYGASIVGLMCIGAMVFTTVGVTTPLEIVGADQTVSIQGALDSVFPGLLPVGVTGLFYWLLGKRANMLVLLVATFVIGIVLSMLGILG